MPELENYESIVGEGVVRELRFLGERLAGLRVVNVNTTRVGGGVAEILNRLIPLLNELGVKARWEVMTGGDEFFELTKRLHNALHGTPASLTPADRATYAAATERNLRALELSADIHVIHDPQPAGLIHARRQVGGKWMWRCHIDVSSPSPGAWEFIAPAVEQYDLGVFSAPQFARHIPICQVLLAPSIDPLSDKNRELSPGEIEDALVKLGIRSDKPIVSQVSRFDHLKDPVGVIDAWRIARKRVDCQLVLAGNGASDDPEGPQVLREVREHADGDPDIHILEMPADGAVLVNAIQRASAVVLQKSLKEGFALTVSEALWKERPVIASGVGGIPLQITHKYSGILTHTIEGTAFWIKLLLSSPDFARRLGKNGREHVRTNFLLTRHLRDYLLCFLYLKMGTDGEVFDL